MSTLILYKNCKIIPERNFRVEYLPTYLSTLTKSTIQDFQLVKHELELEIKVPKNQMDLEMFISNNFNYCSIQNDNGKLVYYFIFGKKWVSKECTRLKLRMDTINSFIDDIVLSDRTKIIRQHKDRFEAKFHYEYVFSAGVEFKNKTFLSIQSFDDTGRIITYENDNGKLLVFDETGFRNPTIYSDISHIGISLVRRVRAISITSNGRIRRLPISSLKRYAFSYDLIDTYSSGKVTLDGNYEYTKVLDGTIRPKIDFYSEGLSPVLYKKTETKMLDQYSLSSNQEDMSFYLVYKNQAEPSSENPNPPVDTFLCADRDIILAGTATKRSGTMRISVDTANTGKFWIAEYDDGNQGAKFTFIRSDNGESVTITLAQNQAIFLSFFITGYPTFMLASYFNLKTWNGSSWVNVSDAEVTGEFAYEGVSNIRIGGRDATPSEMSTLESIFGGSTPIGSRTINSIDKLDKSLSTLIKIIKLPYSPTEISQNEDGEYLVDETTWTYDNNVHMLKLSSNAKNYKFSKYINYPQDLDFITPLKNVVSPLTRTPRDIKYEYKLYHSDFYRPKLVYDSFSFAFQLEKLNSFDNPIKIDFTTTTTINSRFMFVFENYNIIGNSENDYDNVMPIARNNEIVLYNSDYLNYIRTGFNYDVKTKERQETNTIAGSVATGVGGIFSFLGGIATANPALIAGGVALLTSLSVNAITTANSIAQQEQNIQAKLLQTKMQSVSVAGSDDVDLMTKYTDGNKAKLCIYEVSEKLKKALFDVFYYTGYVADIIALPDTSSRKNFNFVSAEIVFKEIPNLPQDIIEDIRNKYQVGITFLHKWENTWDFDQEFENWEVSLPEQQATIVEDTATIAKLNEGKEWVLDPEMSPADLGRIQTTSVNNMVAQKRKRSDLSIVPNSQVEIGRSVVKNADDEFTFNQYDGDGGYPATIRELISEYPNKDYYWTIQVVAGSINSTYQEANYLGALLGYIEEIE